MLNTKNNFSKVVSLICVLALVLTAVLGVPFTASAEEVNEKTELTQPMQEFVEIYREDYSNSTGDLETNPDILRIRAVILFQFRPNSYLLPLPLPVMEDA